MSQITSITTFDFFVQHRDPISLQGTCNLPHIARDPTWISRSIWPTAPDTVRVVELTSSDLGQIARDMRHIMNVDCFRGGGRNGTVSSSKN